MISSKTGAIGSIAFPDAAFVRIRARLMKFIGAGIVNDLTSKDIRCLHNKNHYSSPQQLSTQSYNDDMPEEYDFRLIRDTSRDGAWNMAVDEAILHAVANGISPPTLRLYAWEPACLSLGRAQSIDDVDLGRLRERGWDIVRRPTGGRAILHHQELTYAVIAPERHPIMQGGVLESYRKISAALVRGIENLSVEIAVKGPDPMTDEERTNPICFEVPSAYEISAQGRKIIGSAQVRKRKVVLQHGSLPLSGDLGMICDVLSYTDESTREQAKEALLRKAATLEMLTGREVSWQEAADSMTLGFTLAFGLNLTKSRLVAAEEHQIAQLIEARYRNASWTSQSVREPLE